MSHRGGAVHSVPLTARNEAALDLDRAQQHLSRLLLSEQRDVPAIIEAAERVRRAEFKALSADCDGR